MMLYAHVCSQPRVLNPSFAHRQSRSNIIGFIMIFAGTALTYAQSTTGTKLPHVVGPSPTSANLALTCHARAKADGISILSKNMAIERTFGSKLAAEAETYTTVISDVILVNYLNAIEKKIVSGSKLDDCFVVKLIDDPEPNAYSLPGGFLYITSGFMRAVESEGELTAALAHETAHVTARHFTKIEARRRFWGRVVLTAGPVGYVLRRYAGPVLTSKMLRDAELNADLIGLQYQIAAGYDPAEFLMLLQVATPDPDKPSSFFERIYDSHPLTSTRLQRLRDANRRINFPKTAYTVDTSEFAEARVRLAGFKAH